MSEPAIRVVSVEPLCSALGPSWPLVSNRVLALAHRVVERHLSPGDVADPAGNGLVLRFGAADEDRASRVCGAIHAELGRLLRVVAPSEWEAAVARATQHATLDIDPVFAVSGKRAHLVLGRLGPATLATLVAAASHDPATPEPDEEALLLQMAAAARWFRTEPDGTLVLPIPFKSACRRLVERLGALCRALPQALRDRLVFELVGLSSGMPRSRIDDVGRTLAGMCHGVAIELPGPEPGPVWSGTAPVFATITTDTLLLGGSRAPDGPAKLVRVLDGLGVKLLVKDVATEQALIAVYGAGVAWVTGAAVGAGDPGR